MTDTSLTPAAHLTCVGASRGEVDDALAVLTGLPAGAPAAVVERLNAETLKALQVGAVRQRLEEMGGEARGSTPQEMTAMVAADLQKWTQVVAEAKIQRL